jgi:DNA polymerase-3 subunit alpha
MIFHDHHQHSHFSLNDCVAKIPEIVEASIEAGRTSVTLTDHGTLAGIYQLHKECKNKKVKPILGVEGYFVDDYEHEASNIPYNYSHIILLCKNLEGWNNLKDIQAQAWEKGFLKKPRISLSLLKDKCKSLICTSACFGGLVGWNFFKDRDKYYGDESIQKRKKIIKKRINKFLDMFGEDFYMEVQYNDLDGQCKLNRYCLSLAEQFNIKLVAAGDCHYIKKKDYKIHDIMICHARKKMLTDVDNGTYPTHELYLKDTDKLRSSWQAWHDDYITEEDFNESIKSTLEIRDKVEEFPLKPNIVCLPDYSKSPRNDFNRWVDEGWIQRLSLEQKKDDIYHERLKYELNVFDKLNMHQYMLVCADINKRAKENGIPVGPGRGSVCGSLVAFLMGITEIDPLRFKTSFDRFLIASRLSLPDIDMDFGKSGREKIKEIVKNLYGENNFASIATYGDWKPRGLIKDIGKVLGRPFQEMNEVTKKIDDKTKKFEDEESPINEEIMDWLKENPEIYKPALRLEGINRVKGVHASGMILTPTKLEDWCPIAYMIERDSEEKKPIKVSEWDMYALEDLNVLKIDFLGLTTLDVIKMTVDLINKQDGRIKDIWKLCLNDLENKKVYDMLSKGFLIGLFQLETSEGMYELCKNIKPICFDDIVMIISLYRTAIIEAGMLDEYVSRRNGEDFEYIHPIVKPVLESTLGIMCFQEQCMEVAVVAGGMTPQESDNFRKAIKLKDPEKFKPWKDRFINGCLKNKLTQEEAETLWDWCYKFSGYGFNLAHAVGYGLITYVTAWLKCNYPQEFMTAVMTFNADDDKMMPKYLQECKKLGIKVKKPDINKSSSKFKLVKDKIIQPFTTIKGVGGKVLKSIISCRGLGKFKSFEDFYNRIDKRIANVKVISHLILSGAFNKIENKKLEEIFDIYIELRGKEKVYRQMYCGQCKTRFPCSIKENEADKTMCLNCGGSELFFGPEKCKGKKFNESYIDNEVYGFNTGSNPLKKYVAAIAETKAEPLSALEDIDDGDQLITYGFIKKIKKHIDSRGNEMAFIDLSDGEYDCSLTIFSSDWAKLKEEMTVNCCFLIRAAKNRGNNLLYSSWQGKQKSKIIRLGL